MFFSCCLSSKVGVSIFFNNIFNLQIFKVFLDLNGCFIICDIEVNNKFLILVNIYVFNEDDLNFFCVFFDYLFSFYCEEIIIGGDFNLVFDFNKDKKGGFVKIYKNVLKVVQDFFESFELFDVWRIFNLEVMRYIWC